VLDFAFRSDNRQAGSNPQEMRFCPDRRPSSPNSQVGTESELEPPSGCSRQPKIMSRKIGGHWPTSRYLSGIGEAHCNIHLPYEIARRRLSGLQPILATISIPL
jgi:hypothetical protein